MTMNSKAYINVCIHAWFGYDAKEVCIEIINNYSKADACIYTTRIFVIIPV